MESSNNRLSRLLRSRLSGRAGVNGERVEAMVSPPLKEGQATLRLLTGRVASVFTCDPRQPDKEDSIATEFLTEFRDALEHRYQEIEAMKKHMAQLLAKPVYDANASLPALLRRQA